jgi:hypothetical protein
VRNPLAVFGRLHDGHRTVGSLDKDRCGQSTSARARAAAGTMPIVLASAAVAFRSS